MALHLNLNKFNAGEWSPLLDGRWDLDKYSSACKSLVGMIPLKYGAAERTYGTEFVAETKDSSKFARLIRFRFSASENYIIEAGDNYFRFFKGGTTASAVLDGGSPYEVVTPYAHTDVFGLQFVQINDLMYFVHPDYPPYLLSRFGETNWTMEEVEWLFAPMLDINETSVTIYPTATTGSIQLIASAATFSSGDVGGYYSITQQRLPQEILLDFISIDATVEDTLGVAPDLTFNSSPVPVKGAWTLQTIGLWTGTVTLERRINGGSWSSVRELSATQAGNAAPNDFNYNLSGNEIEENVEYRVSLDIDTYHTDPSLPNPSVRFYVDAVEQTGLAKITAFNSTTSVDADVIVPFELAGATDGAVTTWTEGAFSPKNGYPSAITFFENRLVFGGTESQKQRLWLSKTDKYEDFGVSTPDLLAKDSLSYTLTSVEQNRIKWIRAQKYLLIGTEGEEYSFKGADNQALSPTTLPLVTVEATEGSRSIRPHIVGDSLLFWSRDGRKLHELSYDLGKDGFGTTDITELAEHITESGIVQSAYTQDPYRILWAVRADGVLAGLTYNRKQQVVGWFRRTTQGKFESCESIYGDPDDELWVIAQRDIDGSSVRYIERFARRKTLLEDMLFSDCGVRYSGSTTSTITGLDHLEGMTVQVLNNGDVENDKVVSGGQITLDNVGEKVNIGLKFDTELETMTMEAPAGDGASRGKKKRSTHCTVGMLNTLGGFVGTRWTRRNGRIAEGFNELYFRDTSDLMDDAPPIFTGSKFVELPSGHQEEIRIVYKQDQPLPSTITYLVPRITPKGP